MKVMTNIAVEILYSPNPKSQKLSVFMSNKDAAKMRPAKTGRNPLKIDFI